MVLEVAEAKLARTSDKRVFNRNVKKIVDSIHSKDTAALIESRFKDLKQLWDDVQRKHEGYIESLENSKTTYDVEQEDGWIDQRNLPSAICVQAGGKLCKRSVDYSEQSTQLLR